MEDCKTVWRRRVEVRTADPRKHSKRGGGLVPKLDAQSSYAEQQDMGTSRPHPFCSHLQVCRIADFQAGQSPKPLVGWDLSLPLTHWVKLMSFKGYHPYSLVPDLSRREK